MKQSTQQKQNMKQSKRRKQHIDESDSATTFSKGIKMTEEWKCWGTGPSPHPVSLDLVSWMLTSCCDRGCAEFGVDDSDSLQISLSWFHLGINVQTVMIDTISFAGSAYNFLVPRKEDHFGIFGERQGLMKGEDVQFDWIRKRKETTNSLSMQNPVCLFPLLVPFHDVLCFLHLNLNLVFLLETISISARHNSSAILVQPHLLE